MSTAEIHQFLTALHRIHDRLDKAMDETHAVSTAGEHAEMEPLFHLEETETGIRVGSRYVYRVAGASPAPDGWDLSTRDDVSELNISATVLIEPTGCTASVTVMAIMRDAALSPYPLGEHSLHDARQVHPDSAAAIDALATMVEELESPVTFLKRVHLVVTR
ncbi:hypothetical protein ACQRWP_17775 [Micromonospora trifolii]|uniref:hypothetical protein n=1 Tax=Micromonospora trifolii TaxID=2911208 RepID=UPI003D2EE5D0